MGQITPGSGGQSDSDNGQDDDIPRLLAKRHERVECEHSRDETVEAHEEEEDLVVVCDRVEVLENHDGTPDLECGCEIALCLAKVGEGRVDDLPLISGLSEKVCVRWR